MNHFDDIQDDEIRIIGSNGKKTPPQRKPRWKRWLLWTICIAVWLILALVIFFVAKGGSRRPQASADMVTETEPVTPTVVKSEPAVVYVSDTVINDVQLQILTPVNARPELQVGIPDTGDHAIILAAQAADIRADNGQIVGAFVLKGELLSRGQAKQGFCAIIEDNIFIGIAENTSLLEEATEKDGYFFRQYPLVDNGQMVENKPKNKALRHALCELDGQIVLVGSLTKESFHDFAQALEDLGVRNAIYLVGGQSYGFYRQSPDSIDSWGAQDVQRRFKNVNFILWRAA
ncbi:MAG: phosphodiester glycosidase family protein [Bacteroidales bacterium]|nr:phosphodiester glycosidase family protein [Bacteroidales bacterium]MCR4857734.1 phosphodiester glycosidase family protein [Bacteroidales bacterium]